MYNTSGPTQETKNQASKMNSPSCSSKHSENSTKLNISNDDMPGPVEKTNSNNSDFKTFVFVNVIAQDSTCKPEQTIVKLTLVAVKRRHLLDKESHKLGEPIVQNKLVFLVKNNDYPTELLNSFFKLLKTPLCLVVPDLPSFVNSFPEESPLRNVFDTLSMNTLLEKNASEAENMGKNENDDYQKAEVDSLSRDLCFLNLDNKITPQENKVQIDQTKIHGTDPPAGPRNDCALMLQLATFRPEAFVKLADEQIEQKVQDIII